MILYYDFSRKESTCQCRAHHDNGKIEYVTTSLKKLENSEFFRTHRSTLVRKSVIVSVTQTAECDADGDHQWYVILVDGTNVLTTKRKAKEIERWL